MLRKLSHKFISWIPMAVVVVVVGMLSACGSDIPQFSEEIPAEDINMCFRISASDANSTRSILSEEVGNAIESKIASSDFVVMLFDDTDSRKTLIEILYQDGATASNVNISELGLGEYILKVKLDPSRYSTDSQFSIVVLANWKSLMEGELELTEGETTLDSIFQYTYQVNQIGANGSSPEESWIPSDDSLIPMFGLLHCSLKGYSSALYNEANPMDMGVVNLLRSLVKIEIIDNSRNSGAEILSISLNRRNTRGYLTPRVSGTDNTDQVTSANIPAMIGIANPAGYSEESIRFHKTGNKYVAYVPEISLNSSLVLDDRDHIDVALYYKDYTEVRHIYLSPYDSEGSPTVPHDGWPDEWKFLLRNHVYRYTIKTITIDTGIELTVDVQPYSCVDLNPDFGLERTEDGYIVVRDKDGNIVKYIRTDGSELTLSLTDKWPEVGVFTGVFDSWKRVLVGYFSDGRRIVFNYEGDEETDDKVISWEIYSSNKSPYGAYIMETFGFRTGYSDGEKDKDNNSEVIIPPFTYSIFDQYGYLINQTSYEDREHFQDYKNDPVNTSPPLLRVAYTGERYGDKLVSYYDAAGNIYCQIEIIDGKETYIYENFKNE